MAARQKNPWQTVSIHPLTGVLDTRSRPADIPPGGFRYKQNFAVNSEGKLCRRDGHQRSFSDVLYDNNGVLLSDPSHGAGSNYHNHDHHHQGATREPINFLYESTSSAGIRRLFDGTQSRISVLDSDAGTWTDIATGYGTPGSRWHADELQDVIIFVNNFNGPLSADITAPYTPGPVSSIGDLNTLQMTRCRVVVQFQGFMLLMNVDEGGLTYSSRIRWSDLNLPKSYAVTGPPSLAGFQDLDYGDEILAAAEMMGSLYVYTRRSIWKVSIAGTTTDVFSFTRVYTEPKNQAGCLTFPDTLVSTGSEHWYMARDGIYNFNPYIAAPERQDWLHRADGMIYRTPTTQMDTAFCPSPVAEYFPNERELWFSWPSIGQKGINNLTMVAQIEQKTADLVDTGYTVLCNFRRTPASTNQCNETQDLFGVSGADWCHKSIGGVFFREFARLDASGDPTVDLPLDNEAYYRVGYNSILRGLIPSGFFDRDKRVRNLLIEHDTSDEDEPCMIQVRIGDSYYNVDANDPDDHCAPRWLALPTQLLQCPDTAKIPALIAANQRVAHGMDYKMFRQGRYLYYEIWILNQDGSPAIGGDSCFMLLNFDMMVLPKV